MALGDQIYAMREVVGVPGVYEHHGIDCGDNTVIHYYKKGTPTVSRTLLKTFARGGRIFIKEQPIAFLSSLVVQRAESRLGEQKYDLLTNNCEHFATWCKTGHYESEQLIGFGLHLDRWKLPELRKLIEGTARDRAPEEAITLFHQALTDISSAHQRLRRQYQDAKQAKETWHRVAQEALRRDREDLARAALHRQVAAQKTADKLTQQLAELVEVQLTLERNRRLSESKL
ncbi:MAG: lecithin retinol acyltransferase family protein [Leptolyngbya sp. SIO1E4]|nr:lecithin retinol acyltransferase family protein [Leptolyngbya sp. SIO1E4]